MSKIKTGGYAFPSAAIGDNFRTNNSSMTLRDYFAAKALQGCLPNRMGRDEFGVAR